MSAHIDRVRSAAEAILAGPALLRRWRASLRGPSEARPLLAVLSSLPSHLPTIHALARRARVSEKSVRRVVLRAIGLTTTEVLSALRLARFARQLADGDVPVRTIAIQDFTSTAAFDHFFGRYFGCSPSEYRVCIADRRPNPSDLGPLGGARQTSGRRRSTPADGRRPSRRTARR